MQTKEAEKVYDMVDEAEYKELVKQRRAENDFVEVDGEQPVSRQNWGYGASWWLERGSSRGRSGADIVLAPRVPQEGGVVPLARMALQSSRGVADNATLS